MNGWSTHTKYRDKKKMGERLVELPEHKKEVCTTFDKSVTVPLKLRWYHVHSHNGRHEQ